MSTTTTRTDTSKAALLARLSYRIHELEMEKLAGQVEDWEYREVKASLLRQEKAIEAL